MMTCRLLCALLVLALCCCPSVCESETQQTQADAGGGGERPLPPPPKPSTTRDHVSADTSLISTSLEEEVIEEEIDDPSSKTTTITATQSRENTKTPETNGKDTNSLSPASEGAPPGTIQSGLQSPESAAEKGNVDGDELIFTDEGPESKDVTNNLQTNVNNGKTRSQIDTSLSEEKANKNAETLSKTTTTTTTQAPNTTTTRAPSRLREIDGSLSSSAWVCFPLLLAVSALAYTAAG
ncbi:mucin TcMUCII [Trypanosoma cruzi cruzi]|uniref:Putative mucin TcMUCII n=1 Tax=Trypanosoma cruzi TaxID=5693 RepID=A0A2V2UNW7_TRYCR|nr:mucin TcMUCII [Trypanosoma cruzi cruzi]PWU85731.1 putative mucin TcMUCII [Trypanosoma cruzi]